MYKVRFHLARGVNFEKWQVKNLDTNEVTYYDPNFVSLKLKGCKLKNSKTVANQIYCGKNKTVCAWIECSDIKVDVLIQRYPKYTDYTSRNYYSVTPIFYNPKNHPFWTDEDYNDLDGRCYGFLQTINRQVFYPNP